MFLNMVTVLHPFGGLVLIVPPGQNSTSTDSLRKMPGKMNLSQIARATGLVVGQRVLQRLISASSGKFSVSGA